MNIPNLHKAWGGQTRQTSTPITGTEAEPESKIAKKGSQVANPSLNHYPLSNLSSESATAKVLVVVLAAVASVSASVTSTTGVSSTASAAGVEAATLLAALVGSQTSRADTTTGNSGTAAGSAISVRETLAGDELAAVSVADVLSARRVSDGVDGESKGEERDDSDADHFEGVGGLNVKSKKV